MNTSIPRPRRKENLFSIAYNFLVSLSGMMTHGNQTRGFRHFGLPFLDTRSNFTISSLCLFLIILEDIMVDEFGHLLYKKGYLIHPLHDVLLQNESYERSQ
jgi:hypothetical protein